MLAGGDYFHRDLRTDEARQALRSASARDDTDVHFRQAELRVAPGDAPMAGERKLETAAQGRAVDRRDHGLFARFNCLLNMAQPRILDRPLELVDIGSGDEGAACADEHDRLYIGIGTGSLQALIQTLAHRMTQNVHRRVVDRQNGNVAVGLVIHHSHRFPLSFRYRVAGGRSGIDAGGVCACTLFPGSGCTLRSPS